MTIESAGDTASLANIIISCTCRKRATMEGAFYKTAMKGITPCQGRRPWLSDDDSACDQTPRTLQRGAVERVVLPDTLGHLHPAMVRRRLPGAEQALGNTASSARHGRAARRPGQHAACGRHHLLD